MDNLQKLIRREIDVEFFSCAHAISMVFLYGFFLWLFGIPQVPFVAIFEMFLLAYVMAWFQKLLFLKDRVYSVREHRIRGTFWSIGPVAMMIPLQFLFQWFERLPLYSAWLYDATMLLYFVMIWIVIQRFYEDDSDQLNKMLSQFKNNSRED
jgi:hypothetical protein